ncbi:MAG TPA: class I adenylate-forming enzyme family protein [Acidimicrobiales bacterium]|nr:class I adenylate-forming enzyme family protein [Acidimicrobiales bacterium]
MTSSESFRFRSVVDPTVAAGYRAAGWWGDVTVADLIDRNADELPDGPAFITPEHRMTWAGYRDTANRLASVLLSTDLEPGERVAVLLGDGATIHVALVGNEKAGLVTVGIGARAGELEMQHLIERTGAVALVTTAEHRGADTHELYERLRAGGLPLRHHVVVPVFEAEPDAPVLVDGQVVVVDPAAADRMAERRMGPDDLFMINSTSGTTGLPKCVMHTMNSKLYMAHQAREVGELNPGEVFFGGAPVPFGFGLFTTHFSPLILGAACVLSDRFTASLALELMEREQVTVLVCVSTQFKMMLASPDLPKRDLGPLRVMFTGGEMIGYAAAAAFEDKMGAAVLNFYGSNESGMATGTRVSDTQERRLSTGGSLLVGTEVRLYENGVDVTATGTGQPGSRGPAVCLGYYDDPPANAELFTPDGFVLHADIVTIDDAGYLTVVGRKSDIIIRGGKNISAAVVEDLVAAHPAVTLAAAVAMPDPLFGERVAVYAELLPGESLELPELLAFLETTGTGKENYPEHLIVMDEIPRSSGSKVAKGALREDAQARAKMAEGQAAG